MDVEDTRKSNSRLETHSGRTLQSKAKEKRVSYIRLVMELKLQTTSTACSYIRRKLPVGLQH